MKHIQYFKLLLFLLLSVIYQQSFSQTSLTIKGSLIDEKGTPVDYATLTLFKADTAIFVKRALSSEKGLYIFNDIKPGKYQLTVTTVGYLPFKSKPVILDNASLTIPAIIIKAANQNLKEVTITYKRKTVEQKDDRTVVNVANSILSAGSNVLEVLARIPGVSLDQDNNISLNGKQGATVMIDDKLTYLSGQQLSALLGSIDGNQVQSVEIMTNPSAKYDAAGKAGILNIKLKKNTQSGITGNVTLGLGVYPFKNNTSGTLNYRSGKFSSFLNLDHKDEKAYITSLIDRKVDSSNSLTYLNQKSLISRLQHTNTFRAGTDYETSGRNTIGAEISGFKNNSTQTIDNITAVGKTPETADNYLNTISHISSNDKNFAWSLNDKFRIDTLGQLLTADVDYSRSEYVRNDQNQTSYSFADGTKQLPDFYLQQQTPVIINVRGAKIDYVLPLSKNTKLELGTKYSDRNIDNALKGFTSGNSNNNTELSNDFNYIEKITAGYINFNGRFGTTTLQAGIRAEYTHSTGILDNVPVFNRAYLNWFPTLILSHKLNDNNQFGFKFSKRIERPEYNELNPFKYFSDDYNYFGGNAFLKPEYTTSYELNYNYRKALYLSFGYNHTSDFIAQVLLTDAVSKITRQTYINLNTLNNYYLNISYPYTIIKWWTGDLNTNLIYNQYKTDDNLVGDYNKSKLSYELKTTQLFDLTKNDKLELLIRYNSAKIKGIYNYNHQFETDLGFSHSFAKQRANLKLSVNDIFNTYTYNIGVDEQGNTTNFIWKPTTRSAQLTFTYNFGGK